MTCQRSELKMGRGRLDHTLSESCQMRPQDVPVGPQDVCFLPAIPALLACLSALSFQLGCMVRYSVQQGLGGFNVRIDS